MAGGEIEGQIDTFVNLLTPKLSIQSESFGNKCDETKIISVQRKPLICRISAYILLGRGPSLTSRWWYVSVIVHHRWFRAN
jgi:hypothetical protein